MSERILTMDLYRDVLDALLYMMLLNELSRLRDRPPTAPTCVWAKSK